MAVFERIDLGLVQKLLGAATGAGGELRTVTRGLESLGEAGWEPMKGSAYMSNSGPATINHRAKTTKRPNGLTRLR